MFFEVFETLLIKTKPVFQTFCPSSLRIGKRTLLAGMIECCYREPQFLVKHIMKPKRVAKKSIPHKSNRNKKPNHEKDEKKASVTFGNKVDKWEYIENPES